MGTFIGLLNLKATTCHACVWQSSVDSPHKGSLDIVKRIGMRRMAMSLPHESSQLEIVLMDPLRHYSGH